MIKKDKTKYKTNKWMVFRKNWIAQHPEIKDLFKATKLASIEYRKLNKMPIKENNKIVKKERIYIDLPQDKGINAPITPTKTKDNFSEVFIKKAQGDEKIMVENNINAYLNNSEIELQVYDEYILIDRKSKYPLKDLETINALSEGLNKARIYKINKIKEQQIEQRIGTMPYPSPINRCKNCGKAVEGFEFCSEPCYNAYNSKKEVKLGFFKRKWKTITMLLIIVVGILVIRYWESIKGIFV